MGLTNDSEYLTASNGTSTLYYMDEQLNTVKTLTIKYHGKEVSNINELEYIDGYIWANIWMQNYIVIISPDTG